MNLHLLCGFPILYTSIDPNSYDKEKIVDTITNNYKKQNVRQNWSTSAYETNIHHSAGDEGNEKFTFPNYDKLTKTYIKPLQEYKKFIGLKKDIGLDLCIANYTCSSHKSFMEPHIHFECEFSMIHYLKFDQSQHAPTIFLNPYESWEWWSRTLKNKINCEKTHQAWVYSELNYPTKEDDLIIFPSMFRHFVNNKPSKDPRITVASNITLIQDERTSKDKKLNV